MAGKTLYDILGVPEGAAGEAINAAFSSSRSKLDAAGTEAVAATRLALNEAFRILSNEQLRREYDLRLATARAPSTSVVEAGERSWFASYGRSLLIFMVLASIFGYFYNERRIERLAAERVAEIRRAEAKKNLEELEARRAEELKREEERQNKIAEARQYSLEQQDRMRAKFNSIAVDRQLQQENQRAQQEQDRQRRAEEMQRRREENEARMRLEMEKQKLRALQCANGPC